MFGATLASAGLGSPGDGSLVAHTAGLAAVKTDRLYPPADRLRAARAVEVLERVGDRAARRLLATLAGGAPEAPLTIEAKSALERLAHGAPEML